MTWVASAVAASAAVGLYSANKASSTQANAANQAAQLSQDQFNTTNEQQRPWREAGGRALTKLEGMADYKPFDMATFAQDPSYQFRLDQGTKAIQRGAAARGNRLGGSTLGALQNYGQNLASQEYNNAFNRYQTERNQTLAPYMTLAGYGANANALSANAGATNAANVGNMLTSGAAAQAAGYMGSANAVGQSVGQYLNYNQGNNLIATLRGGGSTAGYGNVVPTNYMSNVG